MPPPESAEPWINFDAHAQRLAEALRAERLTSLVSAAGVGKTTLLVDGLLPLLRQRPGEAVYFVDLWNRSQLDSLQRELGDEPTGDEVRLGLAEAMSASRLSALSQRHGGARLLYVFDHFDWLLAGAEHDPMLERFVDAWAAALDAPDLDAHFLIAVDERAWHRMRARIAHVKQQAFTLLARPGGQQLEPLLLDRQAEDAQAPEVSDADFLASFNESLKRVARPARHGPRLEEFANSLNAIALQASTAARAAAAAQARPVPNAPQRVDAERASLVASQEAQARLTAAAVAAARQAHAERAVLASAREAEQRAAAERLAEAQELKQALAAAEAAAQAAQAEQREQAARHAVAEAARVAEANRLAQALACAEAAAQAALVKQRTEAQHHAQAEAARVAEANRLAQAVAAAEAAAVREAQARHAAEASARSATEAQSLAQAALTSTAPAEPPPSTPAAAAVATRMLVPVAAAARPARASTPWGAALLAVAAVVVLWWWWSARPTWQAQQPTAAAALIAAPAPTPPVQTASTPAPAAVPAVPAVETARYAMWVPTAADSRGAIERELAAAMSTPPAAMQLVAAADGSGLIGGLQAPGHLAVVPLDALRAAHGNAAAPLRVLTPLFPVEVLFIVRADSPIKHIHDLRGQRINIGPAQGDGSHTVREIYRRLTGTEMAAPAQHDNDQALAELVGFGSIDAMAIVEPQPSAWWASLAPGTARRLRLLTLDLSNEADHRMLKAPGTSQSRAGATATRENTTTTLAVMSYLVTSGEGDADSTQLTAMAQALCRELPRLREQGHPKWRALQPDAQLDTGWPVVRAFQSVLSRCAHR